jgi:hypothetical protein
MSSEYPSSRFLTLMLLGALSCACTARASLKVDLNPDNKRSDVLTPEWADWRVRDGVATDSRTFGPITVTLRQSGPAGQGLTADWWKPGLDYPAHMASDGAFVKGGEKGGTLEMVIAGLPPGRHGIATFHNSIWNKPVSRVNVDVDGALRAKGITPSVRVTDDYDAASAFVEVDAVAGKDLVLRFEPDGSGEINNVILNGFEIDAIDPSRQAIKPQPAHNDEHVAPDATLTWTPAKGATAHRVYLGTDPTTVANATPSSPEFKGEQAAATFSTAGLNLNPWTTYFWRVDEIHPDGVTPGEVWRFRVRRLAFPGAEGYGRFAAGGRGGRVIEVTSLEDSGPGTLREACEAEGPRTVVFRLGGTINLKSKIIIRHPYLTVAGQTAPGDGICLRGYSFGCSDTHDVIIRFMRLRVGDESGKTLDGMGARGCEQVIYDHCSISWSIDEGFSSREAHNITFQRSIIAEALNLSVHSHYVGTGKGHSFAGSISGNIGSFHHNLLANCQGRNWSLAGGLDRTGQHLAGRLDIRNNVVYNWGKRTTDGGVRELNFVNNFYIPGPATTVFTLLKPDPGDPDRGMRAYMTGNVIEGRPQFDADNWKAGVFASEADMAKVRSPAPLFEPYVTTQSPREAYEDILKDVGATVPHRDAVDARIIENVRRRNHTFTGSKSGLPGIIDSQADAGGWPEYKSAEPPADSDHDGIPDAWETRHGLNPHDPADGARDAGDGYTHLEHYLN